MDKKRGYSQINSIRIIINIDDLDRKNNSIDINIFKLRNRKKNSERIRV